MTLGTKLTTATQSAGDNSTAIATDAFVLANAGVSTSTQTIWDQDKPPASANALDVELAGASSLSAWPGAWTVAAAGTFDSPVYPSTTPGLLSMQMTGGAWRGYRVAIPAGDFNIAMCAGAFGIDSDFSLVGLGISNATTIDGGGVGNSLWMELGRRTTWGVRYNTLVSSAFATPKSDTTHLVHQGIVMFIRRVGTTYTVGWSPDGRRRIEYTTTLSYTPSNFHVAAFSSQGTDAMEWIRWVRYLASGTATAYGGSRVVLCQ